MGEQRRRSRQEDAVSSQGQVKARGQSESSPGNVQRCHHRSAAGPDRLRAQEDLNAENGEKNVKLKKAQRLFGLNQRLTSFSY